MSSKYFKAFLVSSVASVALFVCGLNYVYEFKVDTFVTSDNANLTTSTSGKQMSKSPSPPKPWSLTCLQKDRLDFYKNKSCNLIAANYMGRLGNVMFQYASMLGIAAANGHFVPVVQEGAYVSKVFNITYTQHELMKGVPWKDYKESHFSTVDESSFHLDRANPARINGYRISWKYFHRIKDLIKKEFTFYPHILKEADQALEGTNITVSGLKASGYTVVGIHARRGDYVTLSLHRPAPDTYFKKAINHFKSKNPKLKLKFVVLCEAMSYMKNLLGNGTEFVYAKAASAPAHMALLTLCNHVILSVGSYGWWGAWLAGGEAYYYPYILNPASPEGRGFRLDDYYPPHWIPIEA